MDCYHNLVRSIIFCVLALSTQVVFAQCDSCNQGASGADWEGDEDSDWNNANNWEGDVLPANNSDVTIDGDLYTNAPVISSASSFTPRDVFVQDNASLTIQATLSFNDDLFVRDNSFVYIQNGSSATGDDINLCKGGTINISGGSLDNTSGSGELRVCTSQPAAATGNTEIIISGGELTSTSADTESGVIDDFVTTSGGGTYTDNTVVLPVELIAFDATISGSRVLLNWSTASEISNDYFEVQRSSSGKDFETIGSIKGFGDSDSRIDYTYTDHSPLKVGFYRLQQFDFDGESEILPIIRVEHPLGQESFHYQYSADRSAPLYTSSTRPFDLTIFDSSGRKVMESEGIEALEMNLANFDSGLYLVRFVQEGVLTVKKMILR